MQYDVFISYRREGGLDLARQLAQQLERLGVSCFFDLEEIQTGKFNEKIYEAIDNSRYFIFILSPRSLDRCANDGDWVRRELEHACSRGLLPIPVLWKGDSPSFPKNLPETLRGISDVQVSFIDHDTAFRATVKQLIEERLDGVVTDSERKRRDAEETFLLKARRFKYDDYVIDKEERAELEAFAEKAGIDVVTCEKLIEQVENEATNKGTPADKTSLVSVKRNLWAWSETGIHEIMRCADYRGQSSRRGFWSALAVIYSGASCSFFVDVLLFDSPIVFSVYYILSLIPTVPLMVRRLRDMGWLPLFVVLLLVPWVNFAFFILLGVMPSKKD